MTLPKKEVTTLVVPQIPDNVPLLMDIMPKLAKLKFEDFNTRQQEGLKRVDYLILDQPNPSQPQVLRPMQWAEGVVHIGLINLLFMPHFSHSLQASTYMKEMLVCFHRGFLWLDRPYRLMPS